MVFVSRNISSLKGLKIALAVVMCLGIVSCSRMYKEGTISPNRVQVAQENYAQEFDISGSYAAQVQSVSSHYRRHGDGTLGLTVAYNPNMRGQGAMEATQKAAEIANKLRSDGVRDVKTDILPVADLPAMRALVTYTSFNALPPKDCTMLSGYNDRDVKTDMDYKMGCTVETIIAKQISRPADLMGRELDRTHMDARGVSNQVNEVRAGAKNSSLGGESTTR
jgi:pilus assembly protein CpaD